MRKGTEKRVLLEANYIITNKATIRQTAKYAGVCKSTIMKDMTKLEEISHQLFNEVRKVLELNKIERASRGGKAIQDYYRNRGLSCYGR